MKEESQQLKALKEAQLRFQGIFDNTFQFIGLLEPDGTLIEANDTALKFGGLTIEQARGLKFWETPWWSLSPEIVDRLKEAIRQAAKGEFVRYDVEVRGGEGQIITIDFSLRPVTDDSGKVIYIVPEGRNIQDKVELEKRLKQSESMLRTFVENTPNAVAMLDKNLHYLVASETWSTDYGVQDQEIIGKHHYDIFPEIREMPHWQEYHRRALSGEVIRSEKDRFEREDGSISWLRYMIQPWKEPSGEVGGIIMFTEDITQRIELEIKVKQSERKYRALFETIDEGIVYQNTLGEITNANKAAERILGLTLEQMTGVKSIDPRWRAIHEDGSDFPGEEHPAMIALKTGKEQRHVIQGIFHPGKNEYVWINANSYPVFDENTGELREVYSTFREITSEYKAKQALLRSEKRFNLAVQGTTAGIWDWLNVDEDEEWWSPKFYELLGYEPGEIPSTVTVFKDLLHPEDVDHTFKLVDRHFKKKTPFLLEYRLKHRSGKYRWFLGSGQATWDENDKAERMVGTIVDIHSSKMAEKAEQERAKELAQKNKQLEEFAYIASHDLQEPVRTISSFVELFKEIYFDKLDDQAKEFLELMDGASQRSQKLIVDLLEYSRIGRDKNLVDVNMDQMVEHILKDLSLKISETHANITHDPLPTISGFETELRLLFQNLITNALKFQHPDVSPKVHISYKEHEEYHEFAVKDNGIGIAPEFHEQIFTVFKRLHVRSKFEGTGIGLANCKKVVDLHDGEIWVDSELGSGSNFHIKLPKLQEENDESQAFSKV